MKKSSYIKINPNKFKIKEAYYQEGSPYESPGFMLIIQVEGQPVYNSAYISYLEWNKKTKRPKINKNGCFITKKIPKDWKLP